MTTLVKNNEIQVYVPLDATITVTPGSGGYVLFGCSVLTPQSPVDPQRLYAATTISVPAGSTVFMRAVGIDGTYTLVTLTAAQVATLNTLLSAEGSLSAPLFIAKDNQASLRTSVGGAADTTYEIAKSVVVPAGSMGPNGSLCWEIELYGTGATDKAFRFFVGAVEISPEPTMTGATNHAYNYRGEFHNSAAAVNKWRNSASKQGTSGIAAFTATTINTAENFTVDIKVKWSSTPVAGQTVGVSVLRMWVEYGA